MNAPHSKCGIRATVSGVRIPPSPPRLFKTGCLPQRWSHLVSAQTPRFCKEALYCASAPKRPNRSLWRQILQTSGLLGFSTELFKPAKLRVHESPSSKSSCWSRAVFEVVISRFESCRPSQPVLSLNFSSHNTQESPQIRGFLRALQSLRFQDSNQNSLFDRIVSRVFLGNGRFAESKSGDWFDTALSGLHSSGLNGSRSMMSARVCSWLSSEKQNGRAMSEGENVAYMRCPFASSSRFSWRQAPAPTS